MHPSGRLYGRERLQLRPTAACDNGSCEFTSCAGCTDVFACNYDATATIDDSSAVLRDGCTDATACSTTPWLLAMMARVSSDGCTDATACNYDPAACDNGI